MPRRKRAWMTSLRLCGSVMSVGTTGCSTMTGATGAGWWRLLGWTRVTNPWKQCMPTQGVKKLCVLIARSRLSVGI